MFCAFHRESSSYRLKASLMRPICCSLMFLMHFICLFVCSFLLCLWGSFFQIKAAFDIWFFFLYAAVRRQQKPSPVHINCSIFFIGLHICWLSKAYGYQVDVWFTIDVIRWISENESFFVVVFIFHLFICKAPNHVVLGWQSHILKAKKIGRFCSKSPRRDHKVENFMHHHFFCCGCFIRLNWNMKLKSKLMIFSLFTK